MAVTKADLVDAIASSCGCSKKGAGDSLGAFIDVVTKELSKGGSVTITGFGTFSVAARAARDGVNPQTGAKIKIAATKVPKFKAGKQLKDAVKK